MPHQFEFRKILCDWSFGAGLFFAALFFGPLRQLNFFVNMPGDIVDARLNLYFLENIYCFLSGSTASLIHLNIFYPYPYVSAFSDNLFGVAPVYLLARLMSLSPESAVQCWFLVGYLANFIAACFAFRIFGQSRSASAIGAILFTFGLPASAQMGHAQLQYRFALALAIAYFYVFLTQKSSRALVISGFWLVWQYYCSIYLGFFTSLFMAMMMFFFFLQEEGLRKWRGRANLPSFVREFTCHVQTLPRFEKISLTICSGLLLLALLCLFYPYLKVTQLYHFARSWVEVSAMSPRLSSYFLADHALFWQVISEKIKDVPIRWEQQLFIGLVPLVLFVIGAYLTPGAFLLRGRLSFLLYTLVALVILTLNVNDSSLWRFLVGLPLFSAIRALSRIILLFLFPLSLFLAVAIDVILKRAFIQKKYLLALISLPLLLEISAVNATTSAKEDWRGHLKNELARLTNDLPNSPILFFAQRSLAFESEELDAMLSAQSKNIPTLNGYSGTLPHHYRAYYGDDCAEYPRRILLYLDFIGQAENGRLYSELAQRVAPIGFVGCEEQWRSKAPMTLSRQALSKDDISQLSLEADPIGQNTRIGTDQPASHLKIKIFNHGTKNISALSVIDRPLRLAWRITNKDGSAPRAWTQPREDQPANILPQGYRRDLPGDIPAGGFVEVLAPIPASVLHERGGVEFSLVQEPTLWGYSLNANTPDTIWAHDLGVATLRIDLSAL